LLNRPVTITRRTPSATEDAYGNPVDAVVTTTTVGELQQQQRSETDQGAWGLAGDIVQTVWLLVLPAGTAIDASDRVTIDGKDYEVIGDPWHARNPRTQQDAHVEVTLRRSRGVGE